MTNTSKTNAKNNTSNIETLNKAIALEIPEIINEKDKMLLEAIAANKVELKDMRKTKTYETIEVSINDRAIEDSYLSKVIDYKVISIKGKTIAHQFSNDSYGILGQITVRDITDNSEMIIGVLLQSGVSLYREAENILLVKYQGNVKKLKKEIINTWCIDSKYTKQLNKLDRDKLAQNKAQEKLEFYQRLASKNSKYNHKSLF